MLLFPVSVSCVCLVVFIISTLCESSRLQPVDVCVKCNALLNCVHISQSFYTVEQVYSVLQ